MINNQFETFFSDLITYLILDILDISTLCVCAESPADTFYKKYVDMATLY